MVHTSVRLQVIGLIAWLFLTFLAASAGGLASIQAASFYAQVTQPAWAPPGWLFGPVWTTLYILMAVAAWLVWRQYGFQGAQRALVVFIVQLVLNGLWTWLFFVWRLGDVATLEIMVLWLLIAVNIRLFWSLNRLAAWLLVPYLAWVSFASFLCLTIWRLNPAVLG